MEKQKTKEKYCDFIYPVIELISNDIYKKKK